MAVLLTLVTKERLLLAPTDTDVRELLSHRLARLAAVDGAHLAPLRQVRETVDGFVLVHDEPQDAALLSGLPPDGSTPEVLAIGLALVQALAALHASGLAHGAVEPGVILLRPDGSVTLTAAGAGWEAEPARASDDVAGLGRLLLDLLDTASIGSPLALLLVRAVDPDPSLRPRLAELGEALERTAQPEPIRAVRRDPAATRLALALGSGELPPSLPMPEALPAATRRHARQRHGLPRRVHAPQLRLSMTVPWRGVLLLVVWCVGVVMLVQGAVGLWRTRTVATTAVAPTESVGPTTRPTVSVDWRAVVTRLDVARRVAIDSGSATELAEVVDPEGPAYAHDVATLQARARAGLVLVGAEVTVTGVTVVDEQRSRVVLKVTDTRGAWELRDSDDTLVTSGSARDAETWRVVLQRDADRWRYAEVSPA